VGRESVGRGWTKKRKLRILCICGIITMNLLVLVIYANKKIVENKNKILLFHPKI
jgi:hypothetical protein